MNDTVLIVERWATALLPAMLDAAVKGAVLLAAAWMVVALMRKASAASRQLVWLLALAGLLALPVVSALAPSWQVLPGWAKVDVPAPAQQGTRTVIAEPPARLRQDQGEARHLALFEDGKGPEGTAGTSDAPSVAVESRGTASALPLPVQSSAKPFPFLAWAMVVWLVGAAVCLAPLVLGHLALWRLARSSRRVEGGPWAALLAKAAQAVGLRRAVVLLQNPHRPMPMIWGTFRPRLLIPAAADDWSEGRRLVVLLHELAHARRCDCLAKSIAHVACAVYWFNPLCWGAFKWMQAEAETACDDLVLSAGSRPSDYATHLLEIASGLRSGMLAAYGSIALARPSRLEGRLRAILDGRRSRRALTRWGILAAVTAVATVAIVLACLKSAGPVTFKDATILLQMDLESSQYARLDPMVRLRVTDPARLQELVAYFPDWDKKPHSSPGEWIDAAMIVLNRSDGGHVTIDVCSNDDLKTYSSSIGHSDQKVHGDFKAFLLKLRKEQAATQPATRLAALDLSEFFQTQPVRCTVKDPSGTIFRDRPGYKEGAVIEPISSGREGRRVGVSVFASEKDALAAWEYRRKNIANIYVLGRSDARHPQPWWVCRGGISCALLVVYDNVVVEVMMHEVRFEQVENQLWATAEKVHVAVTQSGPPPGATTQAATQPTTQETADASDVKSVQAQLERAWRSLLDLDGAVLTIAENSGSDSEPAKRIRADRDRAAERVKSLSRRLRTLLPGDAGERAVQAIEAAQAKGIQDELGKARTQMQNCEEAAADLAARPGPTHPAVTSRQADRDRLKRRVEAFEKRLASLSVAASHPATQPAVEWGNSVSPAPGPIVRVYQIANGRAQEVGNLLAQRVEEKKAKEPGFDLTVGIVEKGVAIVVAGDGAATTWAEQLLLGPGGLASQPATAPSTHAAATGSATQPATRLATQPVAGKAVNGLQCSLALSGTSLRVGDDVRVEATFKNVSAEPLTFYLPRIYAARGLAIRDAKGDRAHQDMTGVGDYGESPCRTLKPGETLVQTLKGKLAWEDRPAVGTSPAAKHVLALRFRDDCIVQYLGDPGKFTIALRLASDGKFPGRMSGAEPEWTGGELWKGDLSSNVVEFEARGEAATGPATRTAGSGPGRQTGTFALEHANAKALLDDGQGISPRRVRIFTMANARAAKLGPTLTQFIKAEEAKSGPLDIAFAIDAESNSIIVAGDEAAIKWATAVLEGGRGIRPEPATAAAPSTSSGPSTQAATSPAGGPISAFMAEMQNRDPAVLYAGDVVRITIGDPSGVPEKARKVQTCVKSDGLLDLPDLKEGVQAAGRSFEDVQKTLSVRYGGATVTMERTGGGPATRPAPADAKPRITIGKDTTVLTEPRKPNGGIDYLAAFNEAYGKGVTKENNAAVAVAEVLGPLEFESESIRLATLKALGVEYKPGQKFLDTNIPEEAFKPPGPNTLADYYLASKDPWKSNEYPELSRWLQANQAPLAQFAEACGRPRFFIPQIEVPGCELLAPMAPIRYIGACRGASRMYALRANLAIGENRPADAWKDIQTMIRLGGLLHQDPRLIFRLVAVAVSEMGDRTAWRLAASGELDAKAARAILAEVERSRPAGLETSVDSDFRFEALDQIAKLSSLPPEQMAGHVAWWQKAGLLLQEALSPANLGVLEAAAKDIDWDSLLRRVNKHHDELAQALKAAPAERSRRLQAVFAEQAAAEERAKKAPGATATAEVRSQWASDLIFAAAQTQAATLRRVVELLDRAAMARDLTRVSLALAAFKAEKGCFPASLADLSPAYLKELPKDVFSGKDLIYKPAVDGHGYVLYSVGENGVDDGGKDRAAGGDDMVVLAGAPTATRPPTPDLPAMPPGPLPPATQPATTSAPAGGAGAFGEVVEQNVEQLARSGVDMDAGLVRVLPDDPKIDPKVKPWEDRLAEAGVDLWMYEGDSPPMPVRGMNLASVRGDNRDWDITAEELARRLEGVKNQTTTMLMADKGKYPATFLVRTREGGLGVLQVLGYSNTRFGGWAVRYKMLRSSRPATKPASRAGSAARLELAKAVLDQKKGIAAAAEVEEAQSTVTEAKAAVNEAEQAVKSAFPPAGEPASKRN